MKQAFAEHLVSTGRISRERLGTLAQSEWLDRESIGRLALLHGLLSGPDIDEILRHQHSEPAYFGEIAVRRGFLTPKQLLILCRGQAIRACLELVEDLALSGQIDLDTGLQAIADFVSRRDFAAVHAGISQEALSARASD
ncbi:MAG: hypothetical protein AMXMBFR13_09220 [Phycisphaerae bacterium]|jgi:hypothetical protein